MRFLRDRRGIRSLSSKRAATRHGSAERGQILVVFALSLIAIMAMAGLLIDVGRAWGDERQGQTAADTAALNAAKAYSLQAPGTLPAARKAAAIAAAQAMSARNGIPAVNVSCPGGTPGPAVVVNFGDEPGFGGKLAHKTGNYVEVVTTRAMQTTFAAVVGQSCWLVRARAVASVVNAATMVTVPYPAVLAELGPNPCDDGAMHTNGSNVHIVGDFISNSGMWGPWSGWTVTGSSTLMANPPNPCGSRDSGPTGTTTVTTAVTFPVTYSYCYPGAPAAACVGHANWTLTNNTTGVSVPCTFKAGSGSSDFSTGNWASVGPGIYCSSSGITVSTAPPPPVDLAGVAYNGSNLWVTVGAGGSLATSPDGVTWTLRTSSFGTTDIAGVAYGGGQWIAVGASSTLATSPDGITWTQRTTGFGGNIAGAAYNGTNLWVAVGAGGRLATSPDGVTWNLRTSNFGTNNIAGVAYGGGKWVAVGVNGKLATSPDGVTWTLQTSGFGTTAIAGVAYGGGQWVAVGASGKVATSPDGVTWTLRTSGFGTDTINEVAYNGSTSWVAVGTNGKLATSADGVTWTLRTSGFGSDTINGVVYNGSNLWVVAGTSGKVATSPDGVTWTLRPSDLGPIRVTFVAAGLIRISASSVNFAPYWDNLAAFSTLGGATTEAINFSGGSGNWSGVMYAPNGQVHFSGADNTTYAGAMWGQTIHESGSNWTLDSSGLGTTSAGPSDYKIGNLVE